ncbi:MAG TPA: 5-dehydro-2-deoxygluconokinase, partial [Terriglobia bacterium]|nr:5-dehydro-2-deoxygluconokinase [Terriglobia bacterium]
MLGRIGYDLYAVELNRPLSDVEHFSRHLGGSSANIAVGLARLGLSVGMISALGKDALAAYLLRALSKESVDTRHVRLVEGYNTSLCLTEVSPPDHFPQVFYRCEPADSQVDIGEAEQAYIRQARMFVTNGTSLCFSPAREATLTALKTARESGLRTVLDIDYRSSSWSAPEEAGREARKVLPWVDVVLGNEDEWALLAGHWETHLQARVAFDLGVKILVRKLGAKGVEAHMRDQTCSAPPLPIKVMSTVGAGDGFAAGFLYALDHDMRLEECLRYGNAAAAVVVSRISCSDAMPRL